MTSGKLVSFCCLAACAAGQYYVPGGGGLLSSELCELPHDRRRRLTDRFERGSERKERVARAVRAEPQAMIDQGDPYALKLMQESRNVVIHNQWMDRARSESLLGLIEAESKLEKSQFIGLQISDRPFTSER